MSAGVAGGNPLKVLDALLKALWHSQVLGAVEQVPVLCTSECSAGLWGSEEKEDSHLGDQEMLLTAGHIAPGVP